MSRNIRTNFLTDKSTFGNSTMPIGSIVPIFKAISEKVTDNGVVVNLGAVVGGVGGGSGYYDDLATVSGYPTAPIDVEFQSGVSLTIGTDIVNIPNHPFIEGDKLTVISTDQAPDRAKFGGSIESFTIGGGGGSNYTSAPLVQVTDNGSGPITSGSFAAEIDVSTGKVTGINVIDGGTGYQFPVVTLVGGGGTGATATPVLATGGVGGVGFDRGFVFYVDVVDANNIRLARSSADLGAGKYYNITTLGSNGTIRVASSTGFGLRVGVAAEDDGTLEFCTPVKAGYGYADGDVVYILQPGSSGTGRIEIVTTTSPTASEPDVQYEGWLYCDGSEYDADMFPLLYQVIENKYGGLGAAYDPSNFGQSSGGITFNVPDYKARKIVGAGGGVSGGGSPVSGNVISTVGATGGRWFFSKTQQEALFDIGNIVISGYPNITEFVGGTLTGEVTIRIGPLEDKMITSVPEHDHALMTSTAPQAGAFEGSSFAVDTHLASYKDTTGQVSFFLPSNGSPLFHSHGVVDYIITDPTLSTFGNTSGIGETIDVTITATNIIGETGGTKFNIPGHDLATGYKIRVKSNDQTTQCTFDVDGVNTAFSTNSEWYVIVIDDDNFYLAKTKYRAKIGDALFATTNGNAGSDIVIELLYKMAGNLPGDTVTVIQQPSDTVWDIDNGYTIGGKTIVNPGGESTKTVTITESNVAGSYTVPAPTAEQSPIVGVSGFLGGAGGGGATTDVSGTNGGDSYYEFNYNGNQIQIVSESGEGGTQGDSGGNGGSGGQCRIVSGGTGATNVNSTGTYTVGGLDIEIQQYYPGNDGVNGSSSAGGEGGVAALIGGAGGDGSRTLFTGTNDVTTTFNTPDSGFVIYNVPQTWPIQQLRATLRGGGGGSGGTGDGGGGWHAGDGGPGKRMTVNLSNPDDIVSLRVYVGGGGERPTNTNTGGNPKYIGGAGSNLGFAGGGNGGNGTGGGGGGGGGGASAIGTSVTMLAGAAGGGGGGAGGSGTQSNDMNGQVTGNDGTQNLSSVFSGSGGNGSASVCSGGGGGGGGGGLGSGAGIGGGGGSGNGSNARREGYGGKRGQTAYKGSGSGGTATFVSEGGAGNGTNVGVGQMADGGGGSVEFVATENQTFLGDGGGGGGSGSYFFFKFEIDDINAGTLVVGSGGNNGGETGQGSIKYQITETTEGDITTSVTSGLFDIASPQVDYVQSGTGSGVNGGFASTDTEKYLRFFGNEAVRFARTIPIDATVTNSKGSEINTVKIRVIRGNGSNGGEQPNEPLELFASNDNATSFTKIGTISSSIGPTTWTMVDIPLPTNMKVANLILEVRQTRSGAGNPDNDNFGIDYVAFAHDQKEETITTYPSGKADLGIEFVTERIEPQGDPLNSAGLEVNEGTFTLSSAVKLNVDSSLQPDIDIPLLTRYHLVKYMIRAY